MKQLYIFDMGGVLSCNFNDIPVMSDYLGITEENFFVYTGENFRKLLDGKIDSNEFWVRFSLTGWGSFGFDLGKFGFPKPQHISREICQGTDFTDSEVKLIGQFGLRKHDSIHLTVKPAMLHYIL